jgi:hypothetical protein
VRCRTSGWQCLVILEVDQAPDAFLYSLASRFDPSAIAVYVQTNRRDGGMPGPSPLKL